MMSHSASASLLTGHGHSVLQRSLSDVQEEQDSFSASQQSATSTAKVSSDRDTEGGADARVDDVQGVDHDGIGYRSQRKPASISLLPGSSLPGMQASGSSKTSTAAASPQTITISEPTARSPSRTVAAITTDLKPLSYPDPSQPRSPKERLDDLLASERSFHTSDDKGPDRVPNSIDSRLVTAANGDSTRSVSDPLSQPKNKPMPDPAPAPVQRPSLVATRTFSDSALPFKLRNSSIDSAISNMSSASHTTKTSLDPGEEDISRLIQAAGSSEALIRYLLKEKHSLGSQNSQLWRLVDKQRAMILGLNKDLERALQDKERYRRKLKETLAASALVAYMPPPSNSDRDNKHPDLRSDSQQSNTVESLVSNALRGTHIHDELPPSPVDVSSTGSPQSSTHPSATEYLIYQPNFNPKSDMRDHARFNASSLPPSSDLPPGPPISERFMADLNKANVRKGPPIPLNLTNPADGIHNEDGYTDDDDASNYDDVLELDDTVSSLPGDQPVEQNTKRQDPYVNACDSDDQQSSAPGNIAVDGQTSQTDALTRGISPSSSRHSDSTFRPRGSSLSPKLESTSTLPRSSSRSYKPQGITPLKAITQSEQSDAEDQHLRLRSPVPLKISKQRAPDMPDSNVNPPESSSIFKGFLIPEYPNLLLPPSALANIDIKVASSRLKPSRASLLKPMKTDEDPVFTLAVLNRLDGHELWRIERDSMSLHYLDQMLKQSSKFSAKTPERTLFSGHAPSKIDARRTALDTYFGEILATRFEMHLAVDLCKYLSENAMEPNVVDVLPSTDSGSEQTTIDPGGRPTKNGYLTKRGKNFGGWKARFFVLDGPLLKYYEAPGGAHLGSIKLPMAEIGKQAPQASANVDQEEDNQYRHAFLIMEPKRKDSSMKVRHVLCAENDKERDQWVAALLTYINYEETDSSDDVPSRIHSRKTSDQSAKLKKKVQGEVNLLSMANTEAESGLKSVGYHNTAPGKLPTRGVSPPRRDTPSPNQSSGNERSQKLPVSIKPISAPRNATVIEDSGAWGNKPSSLVTSQDDKKQRKRSFFGFGPKKGSQLDSETAGGATSNLMQMSYDNHGPIRPSFGAPLAEAVKYCHPANVDVMLPAVVYRCIEFLDAKNAAGEEGIFRLSGSNIVIRQLRERFNTEGDINLVTDEQFYDMHAVASLLKLYLRELPTTILTRELHLDFLAVTELEATPDKVKALNNLVNQLPPCNLSLLRCLASFLIKIINHADVNKMTVRNVGIVFSPTLNIPAPVFALFLQQYEGIFDE